MKSLNQHLKALKNIIQDLADKYTWTVLQEKGYPYKAQTGMPRKARNKITCHNEANSSFYHQRFFYSFPPQHPNRGEYSTVAVLLNSFPKKNHSARTGSTHSKQEVRSNKPYISEVKKKCKRRIYSWKIHRHDCSDAPLKRL